MKMNIFDVCLSVLLFCCLLFFCLLSPPLFCSVLGHFSFFSFVRGMRGLRSLTRREARGEARDEGRPEASLSARALVSPRGESPAARRRREVEAERRLEAAMLRWGARDDRRRGKEEEELDRKPRERRRD